MFLIVLAKGYKRFDISLIQTLMQIYYAAHWRL